LYCHRVLRVREDNKKQKKTGKTIKQSMQRRTLDRTKVVKVEKNRRVRLWMLKNYKNPRPYFFYTYHTILILYTIKRMY